MKSPLIISIAAVAYAVVHSVLASLGVKGWVRRKFGPSASRWYRLAYNIFAGISFLPILGLLVILPDRVLYTIPLPWLVLTGLGQLAGVIVIVVGMWQADAWSFLGLRQIYGEQQPAENQELVTGGLYRWVRHPLYSGGLLLIWFTPVLTVNLLALFVMLTLYLIIGARLEEGRLIHEYGEAYRKYQAEVPMLVPKFW